MPFVQEERDPGAYSCCSKALGEGHYHWHHKEVLKVIADTICSGINHCKRIRPANKTIARIRAGQRPPAAPRTSSSLLSTAQDLELKVDLGKQLKFPENVVVTTLRPDMVLLSKASKQVMLLELPWEDRGPLLMPMRGT